MTSKSLLLSLAGCLLLCCLLQAPGVDAKKKPVIKIVRTALKAGDQDSIGGYPLQLHGERVFYGTVYDNVTFAPIGTVTGSDVVTKLVDSTTSISVEKSVYAFGTNGDSIEISGIQSAGPTATTFLTRPIIGGTGIYTGVYGTQVRQIVAAADFKIPNSVREIVSTLTLYLADLEDDN